MALGRIPDHPAAKWLSLIAGAVVPGFVLALSPGARHAVADAYNAKWPLAVLTGLALTALIATFALRRGDARVISSNDDLVRELRATVDQAADWLCCVGWRGRNHEYLQAIEDRIAGNSRLRYTRVLCGPPHHAVMKNHLARLVKQPGRVRVALLSADACEEPE